MCACVLEIKCLFLDIGTIYIVIKESLLDWPHRAIKIYTCYIWICFITLYIKMYFTIELILSCFCSYYDGLYSLQHVFFLVAWSSISTTHNMDSLQRMARNGVALCNSPESNSLIKQKTNQAICLRHTHTQLGHEMNFKNTCASSIA